MSCVGGWAEIGVGSGEYSRELMDRANSYVQDTSCSEPQQMLELTHRSLLHDNLPRIVREKLELQEQPTTSITSTSTSGGMSGGPGGEKRGGGTQLRVEEEKNAQAVHCAGLRAEADDRTSCLFSWDIHRLKR